MKQVPSGKLKKTFFLLASIYTCAYLFSCFTYCLLPCNYAWSTYAALLFPFLFLGFICVVIPLNIYFFRKQGWLTLLLLFPAWVNISAIYGFHFPKTFVSEKKKNELRILSWNVDAFLYRPYQKPESPEKQQAMIDFIKQMNADILCFQDFAEAPVEYGKVNIQYIADSLGYPYHYFSEDGKNYGTIMFSRFPVMDSGRTKYVERVYPESMAYMDVLFGKDTIRVYNTHLRSMNLHQDNINIGNVGYLEFVKEDTAFLFHSNRLQRLKYFDCIHAGQAVIVKNKLATTKYPYIFCADLNSVPSSYVYHFLQKGLTDAFITAGSGFGQTYHRFSPTLRIDVVLMSKELQPLQYYSPKPDLSDHYPIVTDMQLHN